MSDQETIAAYNLRAEEYAEMTKRDAPDAPLSRFIDALPKGARVFDLGCGPATASAHMRNAGLVPDPMDASPEMVTLANQVHDIAARVGTFEDINGTDKYDGVWANFSLLHADRADLPKYLKALHQALKPGGLFHIGMKLGTDAARDRLGRFYTYVSEDELLTLLSDAGFSHHSTDFGEDMSLAGKVEPWIIVTAHG